MTNEFKMKMEAAAQRTLARESITVCGYGDEREHAEVERQNEWC